MADDVKVEEMSELLGTVSSGVADGLISKVKTLDTSALTGVAGKN